MFYSSVVIVRDLRMWRWELKNGVFMSRAEPDGLLSSGSSAVPRV